MLVGVSLRDSPSLTKACPPGQFRAAPAISSFRSMSCNGVLPAVTPDYPVPTTTSVEVEEIVLAPVSTLTGFLTLVVLPSPTWPTVLPPQA